MSLPYRDNSEGNNADIIEDALGVSDQADYYSLPDGFRIHSRPTICDITLNDKTVFKFKK